nr:MAG: capsid protein [Wenzhou shrew picorna-like virus 1]
MSKVDKEMNVAEPATAPEPVLEQAVERAVENDAGSSGLEAQSTAKVDDVSLEETSIGNSDPVVEVHSSLTDYVDVSSSRSAVSTETAVDIVDKNFVFPPDYFKVIERSFMILDMGMSNSAAPNQYPYRFDVLNALLYNRKSITDKLMYAQYVRFNMEVQVKIMATNFHYGQLMVVWRPSFSPYMPCNYEEKDGYLNVRHYSSAYTTSAREYFTPCQTPYDNVYTGSQLEHHIVPITAGANLTLKLPWTLNRQYIPTKEMMLPENHIGFLDIYKLTPIGPADIDPIRVQLFARLRDVVGFGYRAPTDLCKDWNTITLRRYFAGNDESTRSMVQVKYPPRFSWQSEHSLELGSTNWNLREMPLPDVTKYSARAWWEMNQTGTFTLLQQPEEKTVTEVTPQEEEVMESGELVRQERGGALYSMFNAGVSTANTIAAWVGDALAYFGLSRPPMKGVPNRFMHVAPPVSNSVGPDFCVSNGVNPESLVLNKKSDHAEQVEISRLGATEVYLGYYPLTFTNRRIYTWLYPARCIFTGNFSDKAYKIFYRTPTSMLMEKFALWRGNAKYRLHFSCSSFMVARVGVTIRYDGDAQYQDEQGMVPTQIVEIKGDTTIEGEIPFLYQAPWRTWVQPLARIEVNLLSWPVSWKNAEVGPIYMSAWVSYPGFQVAMPTSRLDVGIPYGIATANGGPSDEPRALVKDDGEIELAKAKEEPCLSCRTDPPEDEVMESGKLPGVTAAHPPKQYGMNDVFTSLYQLAKRFNPVYGRVICPLKPLVMVLQHPTARDEGAIIVQMQPSNSHFAPCFRWVRGSYDLLNVGSYQMVDMLYPDGIYSSTILDERALFLTNQGPTDYGKTLYAYAITNNHMSRNGQSLIASRSPFHSNFPFVSAPSLSMRTTNLRGQIKFQSMCDAQGEMVNVTCADGLAQKNPRMPYMELAYGDDLCYNQWMGCPMGITIADAQNGYFTMSNPKFADSVLSRSA